MSAEQRESETSQGAHDPSAAGGGDADRGWFHRYIGLPFETFVLQGSSTSELTYAVAVGVTFGVFPIMGFSIPLCFLGALVFRSPQPLTHAVNYGVYPLQIPLIFVFVRLGEWIMGAPSVSLAPAEILELARTDFGRFVEEFGLTCLHAVIAWSLAAPFIFFATFQTFRPLISRIRTRNPPPKTA